MTSADTHKRGAAERLYRRSRLSTHHYEILQSESSKHTTRCIILTHQAPWLASIFIQAENIPRGAQIY